MLSAADSPLVAGSVALETAAMPIKVKAIRGFRGVVGGRFREVKVGETIEVSESFARELSHSKKAEALKDDAPKTEVDADSKRSKANAGK